MADQDFGLDLFGDPISEPKNGPGRPEFAWSLERSNRVLLTFAAGGTQADAASAIGCDVKTLRKRFSRECGERRRAAHRMEMRQLERLNAQAEAGNVAAEKALAERLDKLRLRDQASRLVSDRKRAAKPVRKGKKEERQEAAKGVGGRYAPREAPQTLQ